MRVERRRPDVGSGSPLRRLMAGVLATLLLAGTLDAGLVHPCPHHDALPGQGAHRGVHHDAPGDARDGRSHAAREDRSHAAREDQPGAARESQPHDARESQPHDAGHAAETHAGACTCIGDCLAGGGLSLAPAAIVRPGETPVVETTARRLDSGRGEPVRRTAYLLPYSTAPPPQR